MNFSLKNTALVFGVSATLCIGIASAAITPIPSVSNTFAVAGQVIKPSDMNKLAQAINILDLRTNGTAPTDPNHLTDKEYVDTKMASADVWESVSFSDTAPFDVNCVYRDESGLHDVVTPDYIYAVRDWNFDGVTETFKIEKSSKGSWTAYWTGGNAVGSPLKLEKNCSL